MKLTLFSFGFKHGYPEADIVWDVRFLPNPYWEEHLRDYSGLERQVASYALDNPTGREFLKLFSFLLTFTVTRYKTEKREELRCAIGCTGGRHRSVAVTEYLRDILSQCIENKDELIVFHRDIDKEEQGKEVKKHCIEAGQSAGLSEMNPGTHGRKKP